VRTAWVGRGACTSRRSFRRGDPNRARVGARAKTLGVPAFGAVGEAALGFTKIPGESFFKTTSTARRTGKRCVLSMAAQNVALAQRTAFSPWTGSAGVATCTWPAPGCRALSGFSPSPVRWPGLPLFDRLEPDTSSADGSGSGRRRDSRQHARNDDALGHIRPLLLAIG
jgi:hypothetical protein